MVYRRHVWIAIVAIVASIAVGAAQQSADTILYNGKVLTVDKNFGIAQAVAVRGKEIAAVGTDADVLKLAGPNTLKIDLKGKTVTPGLIHTHVHLETIGGYEREVGAVKTRVFNINVRGMKTKEEVLKQIRDVIAAFKAKPGEWMYFIPNWRGDQSKLLFNDLNAAELDKAAPNNPLVVDVGMVVQNINMVSGVAIKELWRKYGDFLKTYGRYWIDNQGNPTGILEPPASRIAWEDQEFANNGLQAKPEDVAPYFRKILYENYSSIGVTTLSGSLNTSQVNAYKLLDSKGELPLRYTYGAMAAFQPGADLKQFKLGAGTDTMFISAMSGRAKDGGGVRECISLKRNDAALAEAAARSAADSGDMNRFAAEWWPKGQCNLDIEYNGGLKGARIKGNYFLEWYRELAANGLRSANSHVAGERTVTLMIDEWEKIDKARPGAVKGWAFDHCNLVAPKDIPRAAKLGLMFSCNMGNAVASNVEAGARSPLVTYGEEVLNTYGSTIKSMLDAGINVSNEGAWQGVETMITRKDTKGKVWGTDQRIDRKTALKVATQNGANYVLKGDKLGSLEAGKWADLLILDQDYMTMPEEQISEMRPLMTMMGGKIIFLRTDFSNEQNLKPAGTEINTYEELQKRRPAGAFGGGD